MQKRELDGMSFFHGGDNRPNRVLGYGLAGVQAVPANIETIIGYVPPSDIVDATIYANALAELAMLMSYATVAIVPSCHMSILTSKLSRTPVLYDENGTVPSLLEKGTLLASADGLIFFGEPPENQKALHDICLANEYFATQISLDTIFWDLSIDVSSRNGSLAVFTNSLSFGLENIESANALMRIGDSQTLSNANKKISFQTKPNTIGSGVVGFASRMDDLRRIYVEQEPFASQLKTAPSVKCRNLDEAAALIAKLASETAIEPMIRAYYSGVPLTDILS